MAPPPPNPYQPAKSEHTGRYLRCQSLQSRRREFLRLHDRPAPRHPSRREIHGSILSRFFRACTRSRQAVRLRRRICTKLCVIMPHSRRAKNSQRITSLRQRAASVVEEEREMNGIAFGQIARSATELRHRIHPLSFLPAKARENLGDQSGGRRDSRRVCKPE